MELMACRNCFWAVRLRNVGVRFLPSSLRLVFIGFGARLVVVGSVCEDLAMAEMGVFREL